MTNNLPATSHPQEATVYDVNGNEVGTIGEIYGVGTSESTATTAQIARSDAD